MLRLLVVSGSGDSFEREFDCQSLTVGRSAKAGLTLPDRYLSREHARITLQDDCLIVEDLGSRNGTFVNEVRIDAPTPVFPGDCIRVSETTLTLDGPGPSSGSREDRAAARALGEAFGAGLSLLVPASELAGERFDLDKTVLEGGDLDYFLERLKVLDDVHRSLARSISLEDLLALILDRLFEHLDPEEGVVFLARDDGTYERVAERNATGLEESYLYSRTLLEEVAGRRQAALVQDALSDERFAGAESIMASGVRSIVAAPLEVDDDSLGLIAMSSRAHVRKFEERDLELLTSLASVAALRLKNLTFAVEAAERRKIEAEVALARSIQEALLPNQLPEIPGYDVLGLNHPSRVVSGDLFQIHEAGEQRAYFFFLCDVSGKGLAAALLTATLEALSASPFARERPPDRICARLNDQLERRTPPDRFATAFLARLDAETGDLVYASAGHNPVLVVRSPGEVERLLRTGLPLGVLAGSAYEARTVALAAGDLVVSYTDGFTEAANGAGEEYGLERLTEVCVAQRAAPLPDLAKAIEADVSSFAGNVPYEDDRTLLLLRRCAEP